MPKKIISIGVSIFLVLFAGAVSSAKTGVSRQFNFSGDFSIPSDATVGKPFPRFSFCNPEPKAGHFCGKVLPKNSKTVNPTGGRPNYTFSWGSVGWPSGLKLNLNGRLTGKPKKAGTYTPTICAKDSAGHKQCLPVNIIIKEKEVQKPVVIETPVQITPAPVIEPSPPTPTPEPEPLPPPPPAKVDAVATIDNAVCNVLEANTNIKNVKTTFGGTMSGPVDVIVTFGYTRGTAHEQFSCGEWTDTSGQYYEHQCTRKEGQPESSTWNFTTAIFTQPGPSFDPGNEMTIPLYASFPYAYPSTGSEKNIKCQ